MAEDIERRRAWMIAQVDQARAKTKDAVRKWRSALRRVQELERDRDSALGDRDSALAQCNEIGSQHEALANSHRNAWEVIMAQQREIQRLKREASQVDDLPFAVATPHGAPYRDADGNLEHVSVEGLLMAPSSEQSSAVELTYQQRCALLWATEEMLIVNDPGSVPKDFDRDNAGILLRQARHALRDPDELPSLATGEARR
jgi:hypothetical protein